MLTRAVFVHKGTEVFVQDIVSGKDAEQILPLLNRLGVGSDEGGDVIYEFKIF